MKLRFELNGRQVEWDCPEGENLRDALRRHGVLSVRDGCDGEGACGLCAVIFDRRVVNSCLILAAQAEGAEVLTVEHFSRNRELSIVQRALLDSSCVQCGYCTPAVVLALHDLLARSPEPSEAQVRDSLSGTMCRCTGYEQFFEAARLASERIRDPSYALPDPVDFRPDLALVGKDRGKVDAAYLVRGEAAFVEDKVEPGACHLRMLGSPHAHAWVVSVDDSAALAMPGVVAVLSSKNCPDIVYTTAGQGAPEPSPHDQRMFPRKVRHVGDRVAAVLAETPGEAEAALAAIKVEYEVLKPVLSIADAKAPNAPIVHSGAVSYVVGGPPEGASTEGDGRDDPIVYQFPLHSDPHRNLAASAAAGIGDVEAGFAAADAVIERTYKCNRVQCTPMEPHVAYAKVEAGRLVIHASTQVPWHVRRIVARAVGLPQNMVRVVKARVGGGFGSKQDIVLEDVVGYLAWKTGRPVYFRYDRREEFTASRTRHAMEITVKLGAKRDGKLTAILMKVDADTGPYGQHSLTVPMNAVSKSLPLLVCENARFEVRTYYTNLSPAGAYQGYGAPKGSFALQAALAELACELGIDQLDMIERNMVRSGARLEILKSLGEGREGAVVTLGECGLDEMLRRGRAAFGPAKPSPAGPDWAVGRGGVILMQGSGLPGVDAANAEVRLLDDGTLMVLSGGADLGTGLDTVVAKIAAETLGVELEDVTVLSGDTDATPFDKGAYASSGTFFSGRAALNAALDLKARVLAAAAGVLGEEASALRIARRGVVEGNRGRITLAELGHRSTLGEGFGELVGFGSFKSDHPAVPFGAHFAEVEVNRRTGDVRVRRFRAYQDCGTPINPGLAKGQVFGGTLKAIGHSLYEEMIYDDAGRCLNPSFLDYKVPGSLEVPEDFYVEFVPIADDVGPFGGKSVSEASVNGAAPAIAVAIHDAVGAWVREWPFTPERVLAAMGRLAAPQDTNRAE
jgi:putative selenate reductase molybdopterin-binding subunit